MPDLRAIIDFIHANGGKTIGEEDAEARALGMTRRQHRASQLNRDTDRSPEDGNSAGGSVRSTRAGAEGIAQTDSESHP